MMNSEAVSHSTMSIWPRAIVIFFLILAVGNGTLLYLALDSQHGYLDPQPYELGLRYQETIERRQNASDAQLHATFSFSAADQHGVRIIGLKIVGLSTAGIVPEKVQLSAIRYSDGAFDSEAELKAVSEETFDGKMKLPLSGLWLFRTKLRAGGSDYLIEQKEILE